jgi:hypothetical protein
MFISGGRKFRSIYTKDCIEKTIITTSVIMTIVRRLIRGFVGFVPQLPPVPLLLLRTPLPNRSAGRRVPHFPPLELDRTPHLDEYELPPEPHFFGVERDEAVLPRLPQLTVLTFEDGRPDQSCIRLPPNGLNRQPLLPHFANPIPSRIILSASLTHTYAILGQKRRRP